MDKAKDLYEKCLDIKVRHYGEGHIETALILNNLGYIYK